MIFCSFCQRLLLETSHRSVRVSLIIEELVEFGDNDTHTHFWTQMNTFLIPSLYLADGNHQYAQLVDNNSSVSSNNSCHWEDRGTDWGQKNGSLILKNKEGRKSFGSASPQPGAEKGRRLDKRSFSAEFGQLPNVLKTNGEDGSICLHC